MGVNVFWDNSNIWLVGRNVCATRESGDESAFRIHFRKLMEFVSNGRNIDFAYVAGSIPPDNDGLWDWFSRMGIQVEKQERGFSSGKEVAVDEAIHLAMANRAIDINGNPATFVLLTGDGAGYDQGRGFIKQLERVKTLGNEIEVVSWGLGCNSRLKNFAQRNGVYRDLESVYEKVTFIDNKRWAVE